MPKKPTKSSEDIAKIEASIFDLNKIKQIRPTAAQLHQRKFALVNRVQRRENKRYWQKVQRTKEKLNKTLTNLKATNGTLTKGPVSPVRIQTRVETKKRLKPTR